MSNTITPNNLENLKLWQKFCDMKSLRVRNLIPRKRAITDKAVTKCILSICIQTIFLLFLTIQQILTLVISINFSFESMILCPNQPTKHKRSYLKWRNLETITIFLNEHFHFSQDVCKNVFKLLFTVKNVTFCKVLHWCRLMFTSIWVVMSCKA